MSTPITSWCWRASSNSGFPTSPKPTTTTFGCSFMYSNLLINKRLQEISWRSFAAFCAKHPDAASLGSAVEAILVCYRRESHARTSRTSPFIRVKQPGFQSLGTSKACRAAIKYAQSDYHNFLRGGIDPTCRFSIKSLKNIGLMYRFFPVRGCPEFIRRKRLTTIEPRRSPYQLRGLNGPSRRLS